MFSRAVIARELLAEARRPSHYSIRFWVGLIAATVLLIAAARLPPNSGPQLFLVIHNLLVLAILLAGPLLTADSISRERREGTLGLLFLTPLTARQIISSKFIVQMARILNLWLLMAPLMMLPALSGGLAWTDALVALQLQISLIFLTLSCGILASAICQRFIAAALLSVALTAFVVALAAGAFTAPFLLRLFTTSSLAILPNVNTFLLCGGNLYTGLNPTGVYPEIWSVFLSRAGGRSLVSYFFGLLFLQLAASFCFALWSIHWAARRAAAKERLVKVETRREAWFRGIFLTPCILKGTFQRVLGAQLDRNPLLWLEFRGAWSRSARWAMVLGVVGFESLWLANGWVHDLERLQVFLTGCFVLAVGFSSASSFQKERESNVFELLLVAPFTETKLLCDRLAAVWRYHQPALITLLLYLFAFSVFDVERARGPLFSPVEFPSRAHLSLLLSFVTLPVAGLFFALRWKHFAAILTGAIVVGILTPLFAFDWVMTIFWLAANPDGGLDFGSVLLGGRMGVLYTAMTHLGIAAVLFRLAYLQLKLREFAGN